MATAAISFAPVLTPHTIGALADNLEQLHFEEKARSLRLLVPFLQGTVAQCFAPLVQGTKKTTFKTRFDKLAKDFEPFRLYLNLRVLNTLGGADFVRYYEQTLLAAIGPLMETARAMDMNPELIQAVIHDYIRVIHTLFQLANSPSLQVNDMSAEHFTLVVSWFRSATRLDYGLTAVFLVLEMTIPRPTPSDKDALLVCLRKGLWEFGQATARVVGSEHMNPVLRSFESPRVAGVQTSRPTHPNNRPLVRPTLGGSRRQDEIEWIARNRDFIDRYRGQWIVLEKNELVASDPDYGKARDTAKRRGIKRPFIFYVPPKDDGGFMGI